MISSSLIGMRRRLLHVIASITLQSPNQGLLERLNSSLEETHFLREWSEDIHDTDIFGAERSNACTDIHGVFSSSCLV
jgi:hypothetical protein